MNETAGDGRTPPLVLDEDRRKHIDLVEGAASRMASASAAAKGWLLPVATATYGYAVTQSDLRVAVLGAFAVLLFWTLDAQYLRQERAFRCLYRAAVAGSVSTYDMRTAPFCRRPASGAADARDQSCRWSRVLLSWSTGGFYLPLLIGGILIGLYVSGGR